jgi:hypothetical protein
MGDGTIDYENLYDKIFVTIIKNIHPGIFRTTKEAIRDGISQINIASLTGNKEFKKTYASLSTKLILEVLNAYEVEKQISNTQLIDVIDTLNGKIQNGFLPRKTEADMVAEERVEMKRATWMAATKERPPSSRPRGLNKRDHPEYRNKDDEEVDEDALLEVLASRYKYAGLDDGLSGGSRRRRKRKRTRKLRKHYKSRKSSNKYIRRKK